MSLLPCYCILWQDACILRVLICGVERKTPHESKVFVLCIAVWSMTAVRHESIFVLCVVLFSVTDAGFKPAVQGGMLETLTGARHNPRAIQNAAAAHARRRTPYDANELLSQVRTRPVNVSMRTTWVRVLIG